MGTILAEAGACRVGEQPSAQILAAEKLRMQESARARETGESSTYVRPGVTMSAAEPRIRIGASALPSRTEASR
ncbi:MAG: hypothetical protein ACSLFJ_15500 [Immundisolibacter sp.]|uniref:hypothetical protein n=1 Tax=Immundisolibacter sp. TaxID=1934948 RepID=UPI003EDF3DDD